VTEASTAVRATTVNSNRHSRVPLLLHLQRSNSQTRMPIRLKSHCSQPQYRFSYTGLLSCVRPTTSSLGSLPLAAAWSEVTLPQPYDKPDTSPVPHRFVCRKRCQVGRRYSSSSKQYWLTAHDDPFAELVHNQDSKSNTRNVFDSLYNREISKARLPSLQTRARVGN
jgi:hypothetical protein